ncbi:hypothetical protein [Streptomyces sp. NPDC058989]|uniref:hypothetical protein n=1 Tax=Streptomyces sp. NPDC058989 TaxID=3346686 RepID=UPI00369BE1C1
MEHLFARWLPQWRLVVVGSDAPPSYEEEWTAASAPSLAEVSAYGAFPLTFAGPDGRRHPVAVERYDIEDPDATSDGPLHASWGLPDDGAEEAFTCWCAPTPGPRVWHWPLPRTPPIVH